MNMRLILVLSLAVNLGERAWAQAPAKGPAAAVDALVKQLRLNPAKRSENAGSMGIHLIDAMGGDATLIAGEPDPGLIYCDWPTWSPDGKMIAYSARPGKNNIAGVRVKVVSLDQGRLERRDLGPGGWPSFSPASDQILAAFFSAAQADRGVQPGLWLMGIDGSRISFIGGGVTSARWSPNREQFMTVQDPPTNVIIVNVRPEKSGVLVAQGFSLLSPPTWAGEDLLVSAITADDGEAIALIDVANPGKAEVREILWRRTKGPDVSPTLPVYSPVTRRCVFVGLDQERIPILYGFTHGGSDSPKPLEKTPPDKNVEDLSISPDGRYVVFGGDRRTAKPAPASTAK